MSYILKYWYILFVMFCISLVARPAFCLLFLGSILLLAGVTAFLVVNKIRKKGINCVGSISDFESDDADEHTPVITFTANTGEIITGTPTVYMSTDLSQIQSQGKIANSEVMVRYDPDQPKTFYLIDEKKFNYVIFIIMILAGSGLLAVGIADLAGYIQI